MFSYFFFAYTYVFFAVIIVFYDILLYLTNFYKISFEKAEVEIEELKNKNRILEKNLEARRNEVIRLKGGLK